MAVLKCKMCGGTLDVTEGMTVCECEYCGTMQTIPSVDDEKKITLFTRANRLRAACGFDKAAGVYENIVSDFPEEAEAYWGLVLCKFGIEYVDNPATGKKILTTIRPVPLPLTTNTFFRTVTSGIIPEKNWTSSLITIFRWQSMKSMPVTAASSTQRASGNILRANPGITEPSRLRISTATNPSISMPTKLPTASWWSRSATSAELISSGKSPGSAIQSDS